MPPVILVSGVDRSFRFAESFPESGRVIKFEALTIRSTLSGKATWRVEQGGGATQQFGPGGAMVMRKLIGKKWELLSPHSRPDHVFAEWIFKKGPRKDVSIPNPSGNARTS